MVALPSPCYSPFFFFLFFFFLASLIHPSDCKCEDKFPCGRLGLLEFPLSNNPGCGLLEIDCHSNPPTVKFGADGPQFEVHRRTENGFIVIDRKLEKQLQTKNCSSLRNLTLVAYNSHSISYTIPSNMTFFSCTKSPERIRDTHLVSKRYKNTSCNSSPVFYYREAPPYASPGEERSTIENCLMITMPAADHPQWGNLFGFLSAEFEVKWNLSKNCTSCLDRGRMCSEDGRCIDTESGRSKKKLILISAVSASAAFLGLCFVLSFLIYSRKKKTEGASTISSPVIWRGPLKDKVENQNAIELFLKNNGNLAPRRYRYSDLKKMTKSFTHKLGKGGYGSVYKGKLPLDGELVAVKILSESRENGEEFINEVASISRTSHINIVALRGFCFEGSRRALIYEFMPNGSLEKFIQSNATSTSATSRLGWDKLFNIALGTARGLEYLHQGCNMRILHFDIKPHNILLDKNFNPKISDFGLAKMCPNRSSVVSMFGARGTIGYIAPEVFCRNFGGVSHKSDVNSYGMMILEMTVGRQNLDNAAAQSSEMYCPDWIYDRLEVNNGMVGFCDGVTNEDEWKLARKMVVVGLWCIQTEPKNRPSISSIVEMLAGSIDHLKIPPKPYLASPHGPALDATSTFENST